MIEKSLLVAVLYKTQPYDQAFLFDDFNMEVHDVSSANPKRVGVL